ncbi:hypothetical protein ACO0QE_000232 [Hanseniaspora vineae]
MDSSEPQNNGNHSHHGNNENHHNNGHTNADKKKKISYWVKRIMQPQNTPVSTTATTTTTTNGVSHPHHRHSHVSTHQNHRKPGPRSRTVRDGEHKSKSGMSPVKSGTREKKEEKVTVEDSRATQGKQIGHNTSNHRDTDANPPLEEASDRESQNSNENTIDNSDNFSTTGVISIKTRKSDYSSYTPVPFQKPVAPGLSSQQQPQGPSGYSQQDNGSIKSFTNATIMSNSDTINSSIIGIPPASIIDRNKMSGNPSTTMSIASQSMINYQPVTNGAASVFSGKVTNHGMTTATTINSSSINAAATPGFSISSQAGNSAARSRTNTIAEPVMGTTAEREEEASEGVTEPSRVTSDNINSLEK